jgi:hypothetical protein
MSKFLERKDKKEYCEIFKKYKGRRLEFKHLGADKNVDPEEYAIIGRALYKGIKLLKKEYSHKTAFKIFKRAFEIRFRVEGSKIHFIDDDERIELWRKWQEKQHKTN